MDRIFAKFWNAAIGFYTVWIAYLGIKYGIINSISVKEKQSMKFLKKIN
jgi:hypothetical protein